MNIIFFGGSFNPPHEAHASMVLEVSRKYRGEKIIMMPTYAPPHKKIASEVPYHHRFAMLKRLARAKNLLKKNARISILERYLPQPNYTVNTIRELRKRCEPANVRILVGEDMFRDLPNWKNPEQLAKMASFIVIPRNTEPAKKSDRNDVPSINGLEFEWLKNPVGDLSSTSIRFRLKQYYEMKKTNLMEAADLETRLRKDLTEPVFQYIMRLKLYE